MENETELSKLKAENAHIIEAFKHPLQKRNFYKYCSEVFRSRLMEVTKVDYKKEFVEYELNVTSTLKTPTNFYNFQKVLIAYSSIVQADFLST